MDLASILKISGGVVALATYVPLILMAARSKGVGQSFATWLLWAMLDLTATVSIVVQHGNFWLVLGFAIGSAAMAGLLLVQGRRAWGRLESTVLALVLVCVSVWIFSGPKWATVAATLALLLAGIPGMLELWRNPQPDLAYVWLGFALANLLALLGGDDWSIEQRFAPGALGLQSLTFLGITCRRKPALPAR